MKEVLNKLQKELEEAQALLNYYEERRDATPRGSAYWRSAANVALLYRGEVFGLKTAIAEIEKAVNIEVQSNAE